MAVKSLNEINETRNIESSIDENTLASGETSAGFFGTFKLFSAIKKFFSGLSAAEKATIRSNIDIGAYNTISGTMTDIAVPSSYATKTLTKNLSNYEYISVYVGLVSSNQFFPRGYIRFPSFIFGSTAGKSYRFDIPLTESGASVSVRYKSDNQIDICKYNTTSSLYLWIIGELPKS